MQQTKLVFAPTGIIDMGQAKGGGGSGSRRLSIQGIVHVSKCKSHSNGDWVCFNEFFAARIGSRIGLPIPAFQLVRFQGNLSTAETWFCSKEINPLSNPSRGSYANLVNRDTFGTIIVFDTWLCNSDRKDAHLLIQPLTSGKETLFIIDHGHTLLTYGEIAKLKSGFNNCDRVLSGCNALVNCIKDPNEIGRGLVSLRSLSEDEIAGWIDDSPAEWIPNQSVLPALKDFLFERRNNLEKILGASFQKFANLKR